PLYRSHSHRALHTFPTRRSSDLYFKEAHPYYQQNVVVIGGKNSAVDTTIELQRAGANVTVLYRGSNYSTSIKPWILPAFEPLVRDRKSTRLNSSHVSISYAVFCL